MSETVYLVMYSRDNEGENVWAVCSTRDVAESWARELKQSQKEQYGFDPKRERYDVVSWVLLTDEA